MRWNEPEVEGCRAEMVANLHRMEASLKTLVGILEDQIVLSRDLREALMKDLGEGD